MSDLTPMMKQYMNIKKNYEDSILFYRLGDFYEMFFEDALVASKELEITLTQRECGLEEKAPMCGVPFHAADSYVNKLIDRGYKVAICEQLEDPALAKGLVKRDVIRVVTPGTITDLNALDEKTNNFLSCIFLDKNGIGITYVDISTGEMYTTQYYGNEKQCIGFLLDELGKISPSEIIANDTFLENKKVIKIISNKINPYISSYNNSLIDVNLMTEKIENHFNIDDIAKLNIADKKYSIISAGILLNYLYETQKVSLGHINNISYYNVSDYMVLDINTRINLELNETIISKAKKGSLLWLLDKTSTAMGGRLLKKWIEQPLINVDKIQQRLNVVQIFYDDIILMDQVKTLLKGIYDLERLTGKIAYGNCNARDLVSLKSSISILPKLRNLLINSNYEILRNIGNTIDCLDDIFVLIDKSIIDEPPLSIKEGGVIKSDYNKELFELRETSVKGKDWLSSLEEQEKQRTGIKSLKIGFNKVFGYYIEISKSYLNLVPENYIRKQTLANGERYITPELKEMESKILGAEGKMIAIEYKIFVEIRDLIKKEAKRIQKASKIVSKLDVLNSFAQVAFKNNYIRPKLNNDGEINIINGRHPVVEELIESELFVPNDTFLDKNDNRVLIITGPNMAGKSTYMRQVALITLMAQIGSFVPADDANIGIVDRIFTRIGASDNLTQGESTFMVEMNEVSNIIKNATKNSLLILDEVGRGTSTSDGLSIAWAVIEYISNNIKAKTLFATHYHELTKLEGKIEGIKNYTISVEKKGEDIIFLRKITRGSTDKSYGIEVAKLAGINSEIIRRANQILLEIENKDEKINIESKQAKTEQLNIFDYKKEDFVNNVKGIDIMKLTPIDAMNILYKIVEKAKNL